MQDKIRIGSRDSALAQWQAFETSKQLHRFIDQTEIVWIKSIGDLVQDKPLNQLGVSGVFTKALDEALLDHRIDIAVHSCKDLPSVLHPDLIICAYLEREESEDVIVSNGPIDWLNDQAFNGVIATGSVRRKAQILATYPNARVVGLRGNVPTRLQKLKNSNWDGAVFAKAGLLRLGISPTYTTVFQCTPAPAQGVVAVVCRKDDLTTFNTLQNINHKATEKTTIIEREFLRLIEGGCISPIGAHAKQDRDKITFSINVLSPDGTDVIAFEDTWLEHEKTTLEIANAAFGKAVGLGAKEIIANIEDHA